MRRRFKNFKQADSWFQLLVLLSCIGVVFANLLFDLHFREWFFYCYFIVGSTQLISFFANWYWMGNQQSKFRKVYAKILLVLLIMLCPPITLIGMFVLLFASPIIAVYYVWFNFSELKDMQFFL